jgi:hypothetical protein
MCLESCLSLGLFSEPASPEVPNFVTGDTRHSYSEYSEYSLAEQVIQDPIPVDDVD